MPGVLLKGEPNSRGEFGQSMSLRIISPGTPAACQNPKIGLEVPFFEGDENVMEEGAWHRFPERGSPETGGNFILSAHRFVMKWTPGDTMNSSPFYNVGKLNEGDEFIVDYKGKRYYYIISKKYAVKPTDVEIEDPVKDMQKDAKLTLYSCTLKGASDGRDVFEAKLKAD